MTVAAAQQIAVLALVACIGAQDDTTARGPVGMVSTAHPLATEAGLNVLNRGGSAFDAAVAIAAALNVVEPAMSGMGGYGTIMVFDAEQGQARFLNPSGRMPLSLDSDVFRVPTPDFRQNRRGAKAVSTPGNANAWETMWQEYGKLEWTELFEEAIQLAGEGFVLSEDDAATIEYGFDDFPDHAKAFYGKEGRPLEAGDRLVQSDLANSLRLVAEQGASAVHGGSIGAAIDAAMREAGGFLALQDLEKNEAEWWEPIEIDYRGYTIMTASPPANSWPAWYDSA